jgi:misacylated tRNA(Ala) deacylase
MTDLLFLDDAYRTSAAATVVAVSAEGIVLDASLFYATSGGQPGDSGRLVWDGGAIDVTTCRKGDTGPVLVPTEGATLPEVGSQVVQEINWDARFGYMKIHTALHLLSVVIPLGVTGGSIGAEKGRLDFLMPEPPEDKQAVEDALNALIAGDHPVNDSWITEDELDANPGLVKTMSVQPPRGAGRIRLVQIGDDNARIDLQPCGGTHVKRTGEIGQIRIGKIENKGKSNRRVNIHLIGG